MISVQRVSHATNETPDVARQIDCHTQVVGFRLGDRDKDGGAIVWGVPPAPDYLRSRPPMPGH